MLPANLSGSSSILRGTYKRSLLATLTTYLIAALLIFGQVPVAALDPSLNESTAKNKQDHSPTEIADQNSARLLRLCAERRYLSAIDFYGTLSSSEKTNPRNCYLAALSYMFRNEFSKAEPLFKGCLAQHLAPQNNWPTVDTELARIRISKELTPAFYREFQKGNEKITVYCGAKNAWMNSVLEVLPSFVDRANEGFDKPTNIKIYLFDDATKYIEFFKAHTDGYTPGPDQSGTGSVNCVIFTQVCRDGSTRGVTDVDDRLGCVLHEYGHALCATTYGDTFFDVVPQWLNEGLADLVAKPLFHDHFDKEPNERLKQMAVSNKAPTYDELCHHFYNKGILPYFLAKLLVNRIFGGKPLIEITRVLDRANSMHGNFDQAIEDELHLNTRDVYEQLVKHYWAETSESTRH